VKARVRTPASSLACLCVLGLVGGGVRAQDEPGGTRSIADLLDAERPAEFRLALLQRLAPERDPFAVLSPDVWRALLADDDAAIGERAARILVHARVELDPVAVVSLLDAPAARRLLLLAFDERPRAAGAIAARHVLAAARGDEPLPLLDRVLAVGFAEAEDQRAHVGTVLAGLRSEDPTVQTSARRVARRLDPSAADRLVVELHRDLVAGSSRRETGPLVPSEREDAEERVRAVLLPALERATEAGLRPVDWIVRELDPAAREVVVEWLDARAPRLAAEILSALADDMFAGALPFERVVLHRSPRTSFASPERAKRLFALLEDPEAGGPHDEIGAEAVRRAAFSALCRAPASVAPNARLLDVVFRRAPDVALGWAVTFAHERADALDEAAITRLWSSGDVVRRTLVPTFVDDDGGLEPQASEVLRRIALSGDTSVDARDAAVRTLLMHAQPAVVAAVWSSIAPEARLGLVGTFAGRDPDERPFVLGLLDEVAARDEEGAAASFALAAARLRAGDDRVVDDLLVAPERWPTAWLRRVEDDVVAAIDPDRLAVLRERIASPEPLPASRRAALVRWLGRARVALGEGEIEMLRRLAGALPAVDGMGHEDYEVRAEALRALLARRDEQLRIRVALAERLASFGLDPATEERALDWIGSETAPVEPEAARLAARVLCARPVPGDGGRDADVPVAPGCAAVGMVAEWFSSGLPREAAEAFAAELDRGRAALPEDAAIDGPAFVRLLVEFWRIDGARPVATGAIARWLLAAVDAPLVEARRDEVEGLRAVAWLAIAETPIARGDYADAHDVLCRAHSAFVHDPPRSLVERALLGEHAPASKRVPLAGLATRCAVTGAYASAEADAPDVDEWIRRAEILAYGDEAAREDAAELRAVLGGTRDSLPNTSETDNPSKR
jgi:hypothetical protein